eukprot:5948472-Alexandrium_andersonii.AAC.1
MLRGLPWAGTGACTLCHEPRMAFEGSSFGGPAQGLLPCATTSSASALVGRRGPSGGGRGRVASREG